MVRDRRHAEAIAVLPPVDPSERIGACPACGRGGWPSENELLQMPLDEMAQAVVARITASGRDGEKYGRVQ